MVDSATLLQLTGEYVSQATANLKRLQELERERQRWEQERRDFTEERDRLRAEIARIRAERDQYLQAVYALTQEEFTLTKEEVFASMAKNTQTLGQLIEELEQAQREP
jgi:hypothetical protein